MTLPGNPEIAADGFPQIEDVDYDNGQIVFDFAKPAEEPAAEGEEPAAEPAGEEPAAEPSSDTYEARYKELQSEFTRKSQELSELKGEVKAMREAQEKAKSDMHRIDPEAEFAALFEGLDPHDLMEDPQKFRNLFEKAVNFATEKRMRSQLDPVLMSLQPVLEQMQIATEVQTLLTKYPDSATMVNEIREVLAQDETGSMTMEQAYKVAKLVSSRAGKPAEAKKANAGPAVPTPQPAPAQPPKEGPGNQAPRTPRPPLAADTGVAGVVEEPPRTVGSIKDAFELALEQAAGGR